MGLSKVAMGWEEANELALILSKKVNEYVSDYYNQVERVGYVLMGRGGLAVGSLLARHLDMRYVFYLPIRRSDFFQWFRNWFHCTWATIFKGLTVDTLVLVDDIIDTGDTVRELLKALYSASTGKEIVVLTLVKRSTATIAGTGYAKLIEHKDYIVFPWEAFDNTPKEEEGPF